MLMRLLTSCPIRACGMLDAVSQYLDLALPLVLATPAVLTDQFLISYADHLETGSS